MDTWRCQLCGWEGEAFREIAWSAVERDGVELIATVCRDVRGCIERRAGARQTAEAGAPNAGLALAQR